MGSLASDVFTSIDVRMCHARGGLYQLGSSRRFYRLDCAGAGLERRRSTGGALPAAQHHVQGAHGGRTGGGGTQHLVAE